MSVVIQQPEKIDEPAEAKDYADRISRVAADGLPVIMQREGNDVAAIVPVGYLEELLDALAMAEAQRLLKKLDLPRLARETPPPQSWFDGDEPRPF